MIIGTIMAVFMLVVARHYSSEIRCKNNIVVMLSKMDFKYTK